MLAAAACAVRARGCGALSAYCIVRARESPDCDTFFEPDRVCPISGSADCASCVCLPPRVLQILYVTDITA